MAKNHWQPKSKIRQEALKYGYRSGLELTVAEQIKKAGLSVFYETEVLQYTIPEEKRKYTPDFIFTKKNGKLMYIETKGRWTGADRKKMKYVLKSNPDLDIRMVFQNPNQKITKGSSTSYESYAIKLGIKHVAKKDIPAEWLKEVAKSASEIKPDQTFF